MKKLKNKIGSSVVALAMLATFSAQTLSTVGNSYAAVANDNAWTQDEYDQNINLGRLLTEKEFKDGKSRTGLSIHKVGGIKYYGPWKHNGGKLNLSDAGAKGISVVKRDGYGYILLKGGGRAVDAHNHPTMDEALLKDGQKIDTEIVKPFKAGVGRKVLPIAGVEFTYFKMNSGALKYLKSLSTPPGTVESVQKALNEYKKAHPEQASKVDTTARVFGKTIKDPKYDCNQNGYTNKEGIVKTHIIYIGGGAPEDTRLEKGSYWFIETHTPTIASREGKAKPFGLTVPVIPESGKYLDMVHAYPKTDRVTLPKIEKDVEEVENDNANYDIGEINPWVINMTAPENLSKYRTLKITDQIDPKLDFVNNSIKVYFTDKNRISEIKKEEEFDKKFYDINLKKDGSLPDNRTFEINFAPTGNFKELEEKIEEKITSEEKRENFRFYILFETKINKTAILGQEIPNEAKVIFDSGNTDEGEIHERISDENTVETSGGLFFKYELTDKIEKSPLAGAIFALKNKGENMEWNQNMIDSNLKEIHEGRFAIKAVLSSQYTETSKEKMPTPGDKIYLRSIQDGNIGIKGLQYTYYFDTEPLGAMTPADSDWETAIKAYGFLAGKDESKTINNDGYINEKDENEFDKNSIKHENVYLHKNEYELKEVKAPNDYVLNQNVIKIIVDKVSYNKNPKQITENKGDFERLEIENKKITIPQTGGIGSVLYIAAGSAAIGVAIYLKKKEKNKK